MNFVDTKLRSDAQVEKPCPELDPVDGIKRLFAAGLKLTDNEVSMLRATRRTPTKATPFYVWPIKRRNDTHKRKSLIVVGRCPFCGFIHDGHGYPISNNPDCSLYGPSLQRVPPLLCGLSIFPKRQPKQEYRMALILDAPPSDIRQEYRRQSGGIVRHISNAVSLTDQSWLPSDVSRAQREILNTGACAARIESLYALECLPRNIARRRAVLEFMELHGGEGSERVRCANAMRAAALGASL